MPRGRPGSWQDGHDCSIAMGGVIRLFHSILRRGSSRTLARLGSFRTRAEAVSGRGVGHPTEALEVQAAPFGHLTEGRGCPRGPCTTGSSRCPGPPSRPTRGRAGVGERWPSRAAIHRRVRAAAWADAVRGSRWPSRRVTACETGGCLAALSRPHDNSRMRRLNQPQIGLQPALHLTLALGRVPIPDYDRLRVVIARICCSTCARNQKGIW